MICEQNKHNATSEKHICIFIQIWEVNCLIYCPRRKNQGTVITGTSIFLYSPMFHNSNNSTAPIDKLLRRRESISLISFHLAAMQQAWLINVCNEGYKRAQIFGSKGNLSLLCNCRASHITRLFSAFAVNNSPHQS